MSGIAQELREEAGKAFHAYEEVFIERVVRRPGWRLVADPLQAVLDSGDENKVRAFIEDMYRGREQLLGATIVFPF